MEVLKLTFSASFILKSLCIGSNVMFQVSPLPQTRKFAKTGDTGEADSAPLVSIAFSGTQFSFYGLFAYWVTGKSGFLVLVYSNVLGLCMGAFYVFQFIAHCKNPAMIKQTWTYLQGIACVFCVQFCATELLPTGRALMFVGLVSSSCSLISACSLVTTVPEVFRKRCSNTLPVAILWCGEASCVLWLLCGLTLGDAYIILPNGVCLIITTFALSLSWYFPTTYEDEPLARQPSMARRHASMAQHCQAGSSANPLEYGTMIRTSSTAGSHLHQRHEPSVSSSHRRMILEPPSKAARFGYSAGTGEQEDAGETGGTPSPPMLYPMTESPDVSPDPSDDDCEGFAALRV